ncbi:MAG: hypothetical protein ABIT04_04210 [Novosphingobium sp.]
MKFLKSEVFRLFTLGFAAGALLVGAPVVGDLAHLALPGVAHAAVAR